MTAPTTALLCVELRRYDEPEETFRFHFLEAEDWAELDLCRHYPEVITTYDDELLYGKYPLGPDGPAYAESGRAQLHAPNASVVRDWLLLTGYRPMEFRHLPDALAYHVTFSICPIEWQRELTASSPFVMDRVKVWVLGDLEQHDGPPDLRAARAEVLAARAARLRAMGVEI